MREAGASSKPYVVIGGTGKTGRRVVARLQRRGLQVRSGSRSGRPPFDWDNEATWEPILTHAEAVYITYYPDLGMPQAPEKIRAFAERAVRLGVNRLVLLSGRGEEGAMRSEQMLQQSGAAWTVLRANWFCQNFSENFLVDQVRAGVVALPVGGVKEPFVDADDIADAAVAALTDSSHIGQVYELSGPSAISFAEATAMIANATGRNIDFVELTIPQFQAALEQQHSPPDVIAFLTKLFITVLDGRNSEPRDGVFRALGRRPRTFAEYAASAAQTGVWSTSP